MCWATVVEITSAIENIPRDELAGLLPEEAAVLALLRTYVNRTVTEPTTRPRRQRRARLRARQEESLTTQG